MVSVGRVTRPHGNRGAVVVMPDTDFGEERFRPGAEVFTNREDAVAPLTVDESREYRGSWVIRFDGFGSIDDAERLRGAELRIPAEKLQPLEAGTYYVHELLGCDVRTRDGISLGQVERVDLATGVPMLAVGSGAEEVLVPLVDAICRRVDAAGRVIEIDPPEGLIDLNRKR
jgi:16S rRNA processing protein RimM